MVGRSGKLLRALARCTRGASALEFAFFAPVLCLALLMMVDAGMAVGARMELDRNVRAGAQAAMSLNNTPAGIDAIVRASAGAPADLAVQVARLCLCRSMAAACNIPCPSGEAPAIVFTIGATRPVSGILLGERLLASSTRVQVR
jgi:pilus assembly protein CpaE